MDRITNYSFSDTNFNFCFTYTFYFFFKLGHVGRRVKNKIWEFQHFNNLCALHFTTFNVNIFTQRKIPDSKMLA